jgi:hypothetical protein
VDDAEQPVRAHNVRPEAPKDDPMSVHDDDCRALRPGRGVVDPIVGRTGRRVSVRVLKSPPFGMVGPDGRQIPGTGDGGTTPPPAPG